MAVHGNVDWSVRLDVLEHKVAQQRRVVFLGVLVGVVLGVALSARIPLLFAQTTKTLDTLTVRQLIVVDAKGVERVRIGAPLPDPIANGRRVPRQGVVSGVLIYDAEGDERGGYVTEEHGDAMLTLDAKGRRQNGKTRVFGVAEPRN